jgi:hypothetical protein
MKGDHLDDFSELAVFMHDYYCDVDFVHFSQFPCYEFLLNKLFSTLVNYTLLYFKFFCGIIIVKATTRFYSQKCSGNLRMFHTTPKSRGDTSFRTFHSLNSYF